jgi:cytochrome P450
VIGETRSPTFDDEESLPYIRAIGKEILRLRPVNRFGPPHYTTADVVYKDLFIPKNTILSVAQYVLHLDPSRYEDPLAFKPERYLEYPLKAGAYIAHPDPYARDHFSFGSGRRVCPGMHLAENSLFITIAKILWAFEIKPPLDETGHETTLDTSDEAYEAGMNTLPKPFKVRFVPRNELRRATLINEWVAAQQEGFSLGDMKVNVDGVVA